MDDLWNQAFWNVRTEKYIKVSLQSYSMSSYNQTAKLKDAYSLYSREYAESPLDIPAEAPRFAYLSGVEKIYPSPLDNDLQEMAIHVNEATKPQSGILSQRVFGQQLDQTKTTAKHLGNLLAERWKIYRAHVQELQEEISDAKNRLTFASRPNSITPPQQATNLEKMLFRLESERRKEQTDFWKDSAELRGKMWETVHEYRATSNRAHLLDGPGASDV